MTIAAAPTAFPVPVLTREDLPFMAAADFTKYVGSVNGAYLAARAAYDDACQNLGDLLTEQIARHIKDKFTGAAVLVAAPATVDGTDGAPVDRLLPSAVMCREGSLLGFVDSLSPVAYMLERLTPHLGLVDCELDISARTWTFPYGR